MQPLGRPISPLHPPRGNSAAGLVSISINQLPPDNLGSFKHQYPKRQREGGARWLHLPARSGAAPSPHRHGNGGVMEGRGHSGCRTHEGPFSNHSEGRKAEGNRLLFCRVPASQGERRATAQRWVSPDGKEQEGSCWEVGTTLSPPGPPQHHPPVIQERAGSDPAGTSPRWGWLHPWGARRDAPSPSRPRAHANKSLPARGGAG